MVGETGVEPVLAKQLVTLARALRKTADHDLEEAPGTRLIVDVARLIVQGCDVQLACRVGMIECVTDDPEMVRSLMQVVQAILGD